MKTVAAISTPRGKGGVAMIRISGDTAYDVAKKVFEPKFAKKADDIKPNSAIYGKFFDENGVFDDGIAIFYCAPKSFTGENTVELCCHGGLLVTQKLLETAIAAGADYAAAGEFTKRAFINGRLTLSEAEAVGGIIDAKSEAYLKTSLLQLDGALSRKINVVFGKLSFLAASVYAYIDYPDEDLTDVSAEEMKVMLQNILEELELLYKTRNYGKAISEGISTAIVGRPNTGKSSVLNFLAGEECAIVTDIEGTTRDVVTEQVKIGNVILNLADTAGIRKSDDLVEKIGISRSLERIEKSEIIFLVLDGDITPEDQEIIKLIKQNKKQSKTIVLYNKSDINMPKLQGMFENEVAFSAKTGSGRSELEKMTAKLCGESECSDIGTVITSARQFASIKKAKEAILEAIKSLDGFTQEIAGLQIEEALAALGELDGKQASDEIVNEIFSHFCVGK